jgi:pSer/pThr/pTyr-binding forkhead associated (FHA) protein
VEDEPEKKDEEEEDNLPETTPIIIAHGSRSSKNVPVTEPAGWLIRHTEDQSSKTYSLWKGNNYVGRKLHDSLKPFIIIDEDLYISRVHAVIIAEGTVDNYNFYIEDSASSNHGAESRNGTYINGKEKRISSKVKLSENDTIQIGVTKLILRYNNHPIKKLVKEVEKSKFMHTVALEL